MQNAKTQALRDWHHAYLNSDNMHAFTLEQIQNYVQTQKELQPC